MHRDSTWLLFSVMRFSCRHFSCETASGIPQGWILGHVSVVPSVLVSPLLRSHTNTHRCTRNLHAQTNGTLVTAGGPVWHDNCTCTLPQTPVLCLFATWLIIPAAIIHSGKTFLKIMHAHTCVYISKFVQCKWWRFALNKWEKLT